MPYYRFEQMEQLVTNPHLSTGKGAVINGTYMTLRNNNKEAGTGSQLHYHPNELMIYPLFGKLNAVVGTDRRVVETGTFLHVPPNAQHSMKACEDGPVSYLYCKDNTWTLAGIAADEAPPDEAPSLDAIKEKFEAGQYPGGEKMPEASAAITEGLNDCYYPITDGRGEAPSSTRAVTTVEGQRIKFVYVDSPAGYRDDHDSCPHERFIYILCGAADTAVDGETKKVSRGDLIHVPKGAKLEFTAAAAPTKYCYFESTPFLESKVAA